LFTFAECIYQIRQRSQTGSNLETIQAARASLTVLADCLPGTLTGEIAAELPTALAGDLVRPEWQPGERLALSELVQRVAMRGGMTEAAARHHLGAVLETLDRNLQENVRFHLFSELPVEINQLVTRERPVPRMHQIVN
jgi:uncharacterized protein (DUF2267 family)